MMISFVYVLLFCVITQVAKAFKFHAQSIAKGRSFKNVPLQMISEKTKKYFSSIDVSSNQVFGAGGSSSLEGLQNMDEIWNKLKNGGWKNSPPPIIFPHETACETSLEKQYDITVCGGTLGIFYATALQAMGYKVCIIERGKVAGREQEWNISEKELEVLIKLNLLTIEELNQIKSIKFNPCRVGFKLDTSPTAKPNGYELYVEDVLNLGVRPDILISIMREKFLKLGGEIYEFYALNKVDIYSNQAVITMKSTKKPTTTTSITDNSNTNTSNDSNISAENTVNMSDSIQISSRLIVDSMGNGSPISRQIRGNIEPDGICIVVGSCARGFDASNNTYSDIIYTNTPITTLSHHTKKEESSSNNVSGNVTDIKVEKVKAAQTQYFWEAFPAGSGPTDRTTYLFTYMDAKPQRPSVSDIFDDYWELMPRYQGVDLDQLQFLRFLYGVFPTYRSSPLQSTYNRILAVGDASGIQSPLSFGGFGSLTRHMERILYSIDDAMKDNLLTADDMNRINCYQPNLSTCWMFQRSMSVPLTRNPKSDLIVNLLANSFSSMNKLGFPILKPFLQDVLQFIPLLNTLLQAAIGDPLTPFKIVPHVGLIAMVDFFGHFWNLYRYTLLSTYMSPLIETILLPGTKDVRERFRWKRAIDAWKFGSGLDYHD